MKKYSLFYLLSAMMFLLVSCGDEPDKGNKDYGVIEPEEGEILFGEDVTLDAKENTLKIVFAASEAWNISTTTSWLKIDKKNGNAGKQIIVLSVNPYLDVYENREGELNLKIGANDTKVMKISQTPALKEMYLSEDTIIFDYQKDATEIVASIKMISNFEWKVKSYPKWMQEPVLADIEKGIATNLLDSTELKLALIIDSLTVKPLQDSIVFIDAKDENNPNTVCKLILNFSGMGLASITWEREAFQRTDPQEDLAFGVMFKSKSDPDGRDFVRYEKDNYTIPVGVGGFPPRLDYLLFYIKTPIEFDYNTKEEALEYFDIFALRTSIDLGYPDNDELAPIKVELTDDWELDKNPKYKRRYWKLYFEEENPTCLRRRYYMYVLPKGNKEKMFQDGVFDKANFGSEGRIFTQCGSSITDPTFRVEGLEKVNYEIEIAPGIVIPQEGLGINIKPGTPKTIHIYANDPYVLLESRLCYINDNPINEDKEWIKCSWILDPNDSKHVTAKLSYIKNDEDSDQIKNMKIMFSGDAYPKGLLIQNNIMVKLENTAVQNIKKKR